MRIGSARLYLSVFTLFNISIVRAKNIVKRKSITNSTEARLLY